MRSEGHRCDYTVADVAICYAVADLLDDPRSLVPDDVRPGGHHAAKAVEGVAALDADRLDFDDDAPGAAIGVGQVLVSEDRRGSRFRIDSGFHGGTPGRLVTAK